MKKPPLVIPYVVPFKYFSLPEFPRIRLIAFLIIYDSVNFLCFTSGKSALLLYSWSWSFWNCNCMPWCTYQSMSAWWGVNANLFFLRITKTCFVLGFSCSLRLEFRKYTQGKSRGESAIYFCILYLLEIIPL